MSIGSIESEHLVWLIKSMKLPADVAAKLVSQARVNPSERPQVRHELMDFLESKLPGTTERLTQLWDVNDRRTVHLWRFANPAGVSDEKALLKMVSGALLRTKRGAALGETWTVLPEPKAAQEPGDARVMSVRHYRGELVAKVRITKKHSWVRAGERRWEPTDRDVEIALEQRGKEPLIKAFAMQADSRKAVIAFASWLAGQDLLNAGRTAYREYVEPLAITQADADALEKRLKLTNYLVQGPHSAGKYSDLKLVAPHVGDAYSAFEPGDELVTTQRASALSIVGFNFRFKHEDGYLEMPHFGFVGLLGRQAHVSFFTNTSRPAMEKILAEVYTQVRGKI